MLREYDYVARQCAIEQVDYQRYATLLATVCANLQSGLDLGLHHLVLIAIAAPLATATANLSSSPMGGWFSNITDHKDKNIVRKWINHQDNVQATAQFDID